jgi:hypothetical protein
MRFELLPAGDHQVADQRHEAVAQLSVIVFGLLVKLVYPSRAKQVAFAFFHLDKFFNHHWVKHNLLLLLKGVGFQAKTA